jgi:plastocyanin
MAAMAIHAQSTTHDLIVTDFEFSPAVIQAVQGDSLRIIPLDSGHTFTQVDEVTWNANGNTPSGLFQFDPLLDTVTVELTGSGTIFYVCSPHAELGMKGLVSVAIASGIHDHGPVRASAFYPNPASETIRMRDPTPDVMEVRFINALGRETARMQVLGSEPLYVGDLPNGLYMVRVLDNTGTELSRQPLVVAH